MKHKQTKEELEDFELTETAYSSIEEMIRCTGNSDILPKFKSLLNEHRMVDSLIKMRLEKKISQEDLAKKMGVTQGSVSKIENGSDNNLKLKIIKQYADALGNNIELELVPKSAAKSYKYHIEKFSQTIIILTELLKCDDTNIQSGVLNVITDGINQLTNVLTGTVEEIKKSSPIFQNSKNKQKVVSESSKPEKKTRQSSKSRASKHTVCA